MNKDKKFKLLCKKIEKTDLASIKKDSLIKQEINSLNQKKLLQLVKKVPHKTIAFIKNPSITIQNLVANKYVQYYCFLKKKDPKSIKTCINQYLGYSHTVKSIVKKYYKTTNPSLEELLYIAERADELFLLFPNISETDLLIISKKFPDIRYSIKNPTPQIEFNYLIIHPDEFLYSNVILSDSMYEDFFKKHRNIEISNGYSVNTVVPLHIVSKHIKSFNKTHWDKYVVSIMRKNKGLTSELLSFLHQETRTKKIKDKIEKHPNYLNSASLILKQINDESFKDKLESIQKLNEEGITSDLATQAILDISSKITSNHEQSIKEIVNIIYSLKK